MYFDLSVYPFIRLLVSPPVILSIWAWSKQRPSYKTTHNLFFPRIAGLKQKENVNFTNRMFTKVLLETVDDYLTFF